MPVALTDMTWPNGEDNDAGLAQELYVAHRDDVMTWPTVKDKATGATLADLATATGDFAMNTGKKFVKVYFTKNTGSLTSTVDGPFDGKSYKNTLSFTMPGSRAETLGFLEFIKNSWLVFIVKERNGRMRILGSKDSPAQLESGEAATGAAITDVKGFPVTFSNEGRIAPVYTGAIPLA